MKHVNQIARDILYNGFTREQQNHLYVIIAPNPQQQQALYKWYIKLHCCEQRTGQTACDQCANCQRVEHDNYLNSVVLARQEDKKSIGVEEVQQLQAQFVTTAYEDGVRFFCIEDADMLTVQAANSILKFLEEPVGQTVGFLFAKNEQKLLPTIRSRAQMVRLLEETNEQLIDEIALKIADPFLAECTKYLIQIGYEPEVVYKHVEQLYATLETYCTKVANGSPYIVAQTELEKIASKTKTATMVLDLFSFILAEHIKTKQCFDAAPEHVSGYMSEHADVFYFKLYHALQLKSQHASMQTIVTQFSLLLCDNENR